MQYWDLNGTEITASDGYLMGILVDNVYSNSKPYGKIAKLKTSAVFESNFFQVLKLTHCLCQVNSIWQFQKIEYNYYFKDYCIHIAYLFLFQGANRCLRFDYALADNNNGGNNATTMTVRISSDSGTSNLVFNTTTGNNWTSTEIDLPAGNNMKVCLGPW